MLTGNIITKVTNTLSFLTITIMNRQYDINTKYTESVDVFYIITELVLLKLSLSA